MGGPGAGCEERWLESKMGDYAFSFFPNDRGGSENGGKGDEKDGSHQWQIYQTRRPIDVGN